MSSRRAGRLSRWRPTRPRWKSNRSSAACSRKCGRRWYDAVSVGNVIAVLEVADARPSPSGPAATSGPAPAQQQQRRSRHAGAVACRRRHVRPQSGRRFGNGGSGAAGGGAGRRSSEHAPRTSWPGGCTRANRPSRTIIFRPASMRRRWRLRRGPRPPGDCLGCVLRACGRPHPPLARSTASAAGSTASICGRPGPTPSAWPSITRASCTSFRWRRRRARRSGEFQAGCQGVGRLRSGDPDAQRNPPALMTVTNLGGCQRGELHADHQSAGSGHPGRRPGEADSVARADGSIAVDPVESHPQRGPPYRQRQVRGRLSRALSRSSNDRRRQRHDRKSAGRFPLGLYRARSDPHSAV